MADSDPKATFGYAIQVLNDVNLACRHLLAPGTVYGGGVAAYTDYSTLAARAYFLA
ncbi:MAG: hypothetical protein ACFCVD_06430 [Nodosilinea sp.]